MLMRLQVCLAFDQVIRAGEMGHSMYFINHGSVRVTASNGKCPLDIHYPGSCFGQTEILLKRPKWIFDTRCLENSELYKIAVDDLHELLDEFPQVKEQMFEVGAVRIESYQKILIEWIQRASPDDHADADSWHKIILIRVAETDLTKIMDSFIKVEIGETYSKSTSVQYNNRTPAWPTEVFMLEMELESGLLSKDIWRKEKITISLYEKKVFTADSLLGVARITLASLAALPRTESIDKWIGVKGKRGRGNRLRMNVWVRRHGLCLRDQCKLTRQALAELLAGPNSAGDVPDIAVLAHKQLQLRDDISQILKSLQS